MTQDAEANEPRIEVYLDQIKTIEDLAEAILDHEDNGPCCECGSSDHTCQDCPTFMDAPSEFDETVQQNDGG